MNTRKGSTNQLPTMQPLAIQSFSYDERASVLPLLNETFADCGGWILDRRIISPATLEFHVEIQLRSILDLYAAILAAGVELTRSAHIALTYLCTCRQHMSTPADLGQIVLLRIEVSFLEDVTLHSFLNSNPPPS
jgi:hypothetical protein